MTQEQLIQEVHNNSAGTLDQLKLLADLSQAFVQSLDIDETLDFAVEQIADHMNAEASSVFLFNSKNEKLVLCVM